MCDLDNNQSGDIPLVGTIRVSCFIECLEYGGNGGRTNIKTESFAKKDIVIIEEFNESSGPKDFTRPRHDNPQSRLLSSEKICIRIVWMRVTNPNICKYDQIPNTLSQHHRAEQHELLLPLHLLCQCVITLSTREYLILKNLLAFDLC